MPALYPSRRPLLLAEGMFETALEQGAWSGWRRLAHAGSTSTLEVMLPEPALTAPDLVFAPRAVSGPIKLAEAFFSDVRFRSLTPVGAPPPQHAAASQSPGARSIQSYQQLVRRIRAAVAHLVPPEATVVVVS